MSNLKESKPAKRKYERRLETDVFPILNIDKEAKINPEKQLTSLDNAYILLARGMPLVQVALITCLDQIQKEVNIFEPKQEVVKEANEEEQELNIEFINSLLDSGLITENTSMWQKLHELYELQQRPLPENTLDQIRLEALFAAFFAAESDTDSALLTQYRDLVGKITDAHFTSKLSSEEKFIKSKVCKEWRWDGVDNEGLLYVYTQDGKGYEFDGVTDEKGNFHFLTVDILRKRIKSKSWRRETPERYKEMAQWNPSPADLVK